jgi:hypothetical protein
VGFKKVKVITLVTPAGGYPHCNRNKPILLSPSEQKLNLSIFKMALRVISDILVT